MHEQLILSLALIFATPTTDHLQPGQSEPKIPLTEQDLGGGIIVSVSKLDYKLTKDGITADGIVEAYGGHGTVHGRQGFTKEIDVKLSGVDVAKIAAVIAPELPSEVIKKAQGSIGNVVIKVKGDVVTLFADKFRIPGDPLLKLSATANLKSRVWEAKAYALGGIFELSGNLPE